MDKINLPPRRYGIQGFRKFQIFYPSDINSSETLYGHLPATWELPPCLCGALCLFDNGLCPDCFRKYCE